VLFFTRCTVNEFYDFTYYSVSARCTAAVHYSKDFWKESLLDVAQNVGFMSMGEQGSTDGRIYGGTNEINNDAEAVQSTVLSDYFSLDDRVGTAAAVNMTLMSLMASLGYIYTVYTATLPICSMRQIGSRAVVCGRAVFITGQACCIEQPIYPRH